jgi:RNA polymerase sigma-70 factor (ECF subfamily)
VSDSAPQALGPRQGSGRAATTTASVERTLDLLSRARNGDGAALDAILRRYMPRLQRWATGRLPRAARNFRDTQDIVQEALVRVVQHIEDFQPRHEAAFQAYARKILFNLIKDVSRREVPRPFTSVLDGNEVDPGPPPIEEVIGWELAERYEAALDRLRPEDREGIILRIEFGYSYQEIAEAMGKPSADAARMAVSRALLSLAEELRDENE